MSQRRPLPLLQELKRRHVFKVGGVYLVGAWLVLQVVALVFPALRLPPWTITLVVVLALIGFPLALVLAWALELTPEGLRPTQPPEAEPAAPPPPTGEDRRGRAAPPPERAPGERDAPRALAVLPFANLSPDAESEYFSDGITEELIDALSRLEGLRVASRTSSFAFRGDKGADVRQIAESLRVGFVLEGGVRRSGNRLRVTTRLVEAGTGLHLWSRKYDRQMDDVFAVQEEIAQEVAAALEVEFAGEGAGLVRPGTRDLDAHDLFLKGRYHLQRRTREGLQRAVGYFDQAVERDARFALAHAARAEAYNILWDYGIVPPAVARRSAAEAARAAVRLDPSSVEAATALAVVDQLDWNFAAAEEGLRRVISAHPRHASAHHRLALLLTWLGRTDEAREHIQQARQLEPLSLIINTTTGWVEYFARSHEAAASELTAVLDLDPHYALAHLLLGRVRLATGRPDQGIEAYRAAIRLGGETPAALGLLAHGLAGAGEREEASRVADALAAGAPQRPGSPYHSAIALLGLGERERALAELQRAHQQRDPSLVLLGVDPILDPLRGDPIAQGLMETMGLTPVPDPLVVS